MTRESLGHVDHDEWRQLGVSRMPPMSARTRFVVPDMLRPLVDERLAALAAPFVGVTTDGALRGGLWNLDRMPETETAPMAAAVSTFLAALTPQQRDQASFPMHADEWRQWMNVHVNLYRHGVMLEDLPAPTRELAVDIMRTALSARGFEQARSIMLINEMVADLTGDHDAFGGWLYFMSVFGSPGGSEPWGWQIDGHHLCLSVAVIDGRVVSTPAFMGSEPRSVRSGPYAPMSLFDPEESRATLLINSLDPSQRAAAIIHPSIASAHLPPYLQHPVDGRMQAGAAYDNAVVPYQGIAGADLDGDQRRLLLELADAYLSWNPEDQAAPRLRDVEAHLDETWFCWYGETGEQSAFYYRLHSPVVLIEFDHHAGVVFEIAEPNRHHVHSLVRTPNGGDYGADLLRQHHAKYDHSSGTHELRHEPAPAEQ